MNIENVLDKLYDLPVKIVEHYKPTHNTVSEFIRVSCLYGGKKFVHFDEIASFFDRYIGNMRAVRVLLQNIFTRRGLYNYAPYFLIVIPITYEKKLTYAVLTTSVASRFKIRTSKCYYTPNWLLLVKTAAYHNEDPRYFNLITFPTKGKNWLLRGFQSTKSIIVPVPILELWLEYGLDHLVKHFVNYVITLISDYES